MLSRLSFKGLSAEGSKKQISVTQISIDLSEGCLGIVAGLICSCEIDSLRKACEHKSLCVLIAFEMFQRLRPYEHRGGTKLGVTFFVCFCESDGLFICLLFSRVGGLHVFKCIHLARSVLI